MPKLLPRWAYQLVAVLALFLVWGVAIDLAWHEGIPFRALARAIGVVLASVVVWVIATLAWALLVLPLRMISDAPSLVPPSREALRDAWARAQAEAHDESTPAARRRRAFRMAGAASVIELAAMVAVAANAELLPGTILVAPVLLALACAVLGVYYFARGLLSR